MSIYEIFSLIFICISTLIYSLSMIFKTRIKVLFIQLISTTFFLANYLVVINIIPSALVGAITAAIELLRLIVFYIIDNNKKLNTKTINWYAGTFFVLLISICSLINWTGWIGFLPVIGSVIVSLALASKDMIIIKLGFLINIMLTIAYLIVLSLWLNAITQVLALIFIVIGLIKQVLVKNNENIEKTEF